MARDWNPLLAAIIAGAVALAGYILTQIAGRRERKGRSYAEALAAIRKYQELPYLVRRRPASDSLSRFAIAQQVSDVMAKLGFYSSWLQIVDSDEVGNAYNDLVTETRRQGRAHLFTAWREPVIQADADMVGTRTPFLWDIEPELTLCMLAMRRELSFWGPARRRTIQASLAAQRAKRTEESEQAVSK